MTGDRGANAYRGTDRRSATDMSPVDYRGPDRRGLMPPGVRPAGLKVAVLACAVAVLVVVAVRATLLSGRGQAVTFAAFRDTGFGLLVLTGTVLLVVWALTGRAARALDGSALLLIAGGMLVLGGPWAALFQTGTAATLISPACRLALGLPTLVVLIRSPKALPVDSSIRPLGTLTAAAACSLVLLGIEALVHIWQPMGNRWLWVAAMALLALCWAVAGGRRLLATEATVSARGERAMGLAMVTFAAGDVLLAVTLRTKLSWGVVGVGLQLLGAVIAAAVSVSWLLGVLSRDGSRKLRLVGELSEVTTVLADEQSLRSRLVHDARNVVAAIHTATVTLERHGDRLDPIVQEQLRGAVGSELARLQSLLDTPARDTSALS